MPLLVRILALLVCPMAVVWAQEQEEGKPAGVVEELKYKQHPGLAYAASKIYFSDRRYSLSGFGEINAVMSGGGEQTREGGDIELYYTNLYRFSTFFGYKFSPKWIFNFEFLGELLQDGTQEFGRDIVIEAMLDYLMHQNLNFRFGFYPVPIGYVNNNDEPVMFRSVNRPEVERLVIPSSWISLGAMAFGEIPKARGWYYTLGVVGGLDAIEFQPGSWIRQGRQIHHGIPSEAAAHAQIAWQRSEHWQAGFSAYRGQSGSAIEDGGDRLRMPTSLGAGHVRYASGEFSVVGVAAAGTLGNTEGLYNQTGRVLGGRANGLYVEPSYALGRGKWPVFVRLERLNTHARVAESLQGVRAGESDLRIVTIGANYMPKRNLVFKSNYQFRRNRSPYGAPEANLVEFGFGFIF
jgi:hypothetical protein